MPINNEFAVNVFNSILNHKPELKIYLSDTPINGGIDIRKLKQIIVEEFPWPIGNELRRLFSADMDSLSKKRMDHIEKLVERTFQYISFVLLSQLVEEIEKKNIKITDDLNKVFQKSTIALVFGNYTCIIRKISSLFRKSKIQPFIKEMEDSFNKKLLHKMDSWVPDRNDVSHHNLGLTEEEIEIRCFEYLKKAEELFSELSFLTKYPLLTISKIEVLKTKRMDAKYYHRMLLLNSPSSKFSSEEHHLDSFTDCPAVILTNSKKNAHNNFINLSPFIIDTHNEIINTREKLNSVKKDVYLFQKWDKTKKRLHYAGTKSSEIPDLRQLSNYQILVDEFQTILDILNIDK